MFSFLYSLLAWSGYTSPAPFVPFFSCSLSSLLVLLSPVTPNFPNASPNYSHHLFDAVPIALNLTNILNSPQPIFDLLRRSTKSLQIFCCYHKEEDEEEMFAILVWRLHRRRSERFAQNPNTRFPGSSCWVWITEGTNLVVIPLRFDSIPPLIPSYCSGFGKRVSLRWIWIRLILTFDLSFWWLSHRSDSWSRNLNSLDSELAGFCDEDEDLASCRLRRFLEVISSLWRFDLFDLNPSILQVEEKNREKRNLDILYCLICYSFNNRAFYSFIF